MSLHFGIVIQNILVFRRGGAKKQESNIAEVIAIINLVSIKGQILNLQQKNALKTNGLERILNIKKHKDMSQLFVKYENKGQKKQVVSKLVTPC